MSTKIFGGYFMTEKKGRKPQTRTTIRIPEETKDQLKHISIEEHMYLQDIIEKFLTLGIEQYNKKKKE